MYNNLSIVFNKLIKFIEKFYFVFITILLLIAVFNIFFNLGNYPISSWDEARHGVSAYEMIKNKNYIVNTYAYQNDYWNLKPPLSFWAIILGFKLFGFNALGLRFFSALASFITILTVTIFMNKRHGRLASLISALVLITTYQYIFLHNSRTGDADSLYVLFFTLSMICMILIEENIKWIYPAGLFFSLAFLTKSWHALNIVIIGGIYLLASKALFKLKLKQWIKFTIVSSLPILTWGLLRYTYDGMKFFKTMITFDLLERTSKVLEGHVGSRTFYFDLINSNYPYWILVLVGGLVAILATTNMDTLKRNKNYIIAILFWILVPFLMYTRAKTKIAWYILPLYPPMAICVGAFVNKLIKTEKRNLILAGTLAFLIIFSAYKNERIILQGIIYPSVDYTQQILMNLKSSKEDKYSNIYTLYGNKNNPFDWEQCYLLTAELYGDLLPKEGGIQGFLEDNNPDSILLIPKSFTPEVYCSSMNEIMDVKTFINKNKFKVVMENDYNYILKK